MLRVNVPLSEEEMDGLVVLAQLECRHPREQARFLLRQELFRRGLLVTDQEREQRVCAQVQCALAVE